MISPFLGTIGTFVTGSDLSSNLLFGDLQHSVAEGLKPGSDILKSLLIASNTAEASYVLYFLILFYTLFLKNVGRQGFSLDLQSFTYNWIYGDKLVPTMNIIMFIPLGFLCKLSWKHVAYFTLAISLVEGSQYLFHLGIFDLGDILTNLLGFIIGSYLLETALGKWVVRHIH